MAPLPSSYLALPSNVSAMPDPYDGGRRRSAGDLWPTIFLVAYVVDAVEEPPSEPHKDLGPGADDMSVLERLEPPCLILKLRAC